ncbi:MAG: alpha/beta hydrolase [Siculibacillus sp.]|nr:alpha/beta hydrolase [Siculibacillus sp.]
MISAWLAPAFLVPAGAAVASRLSARAAEAAHPPIGELLALADRTVHVVDRPGADPTATPLVFVHGASGNARDPMLAFAEALARHRLIFLDRPGHGWSSRCGPDDARPTTQAGVVAEILDALGIDRAIVVGHSWGGSVAAAFGVHHPDRAAGLVFLAPATHPWPGAVIDILYRLSAAPIAGTLLDRFVVPTVGRLLVDGSIAGVFAPDPPPADYRRAIGVDLLLRPEQWRANAEDVHRLHAQVSELSPRYPEISAPTLIVSGTRDAIVRADIHAEGLAKDIAGSRLVWLDGIGHMPHHAARERVIEEIEGLIAEVEA